jgi:hypothetical protein
MKFQKKHFRISTSVCQIAIPNQDRYRQTVLLDFDFGI